ncbi:MAG: efflux RND transporter periplasmic adaptor subunit [Nitrospirae bacterium]|nr:efflux RND transporter periplasmic adaptor subunit [Nitrospirota bacterium]
MIRTGTILLTAFLLLAQGAVFAGTLELTSEQTAGLELATTTVEHHKATSVVQVNGTLMPDQNGVFRIGPVVDGFVMALNAVANDRVTKGQVLARLRSNTLGQAQADYLEALSRFEVTRASQERVEGLWRDGVVAESRWIEADSGYMAARAALDQRRRQLTLAGLSNEQIDALKDRPDRIADFELVSPVDGVVLSASVETGQMLSPGETVFRVADLSRLWAEVRIPIAALRRLGTGGKATLQVNAYPDDSFTGRLESLSGEVDADSQTVSGRVVIKNPGGLLRPGMYVRVDLTGDGQAGLMVPASAVFRSGDNTYLFKVLGPGRFEPVPITVGAELNGWVPVRGGVVAGTEIVSKGVAELKSHWQYQGGK